MTRVCVTGGQKFNDKELLLSTMEKLHQQYHFTELWHGDCPVGADKFADEWATSRFIQTRKFTADPLSWTIYGKGAGIVRNTVMADARPDLVVAFPGANGTRDMVRKARARNIELIIAGDWL